MKSRGGSQRPEREDVRRAITTALQTGKVVLQSKALVAFPESLFTAGEQVDNWWTIEPLRLLDLSINEIAVIPPGFSQFKETLTTLRLSSNKLTSLPYDLGECSALRLLDVSGNAFHILPEAILDLHGLASLDLSGNALSQLVPSAAIWPVLEVLRVNENQLEILPPDLGSCGLLSHLEVSGNKLKSLPETIGTCRRLRELRVARNALSALPVSLRELPALAILDCRQNAINDFPFMPSQITEAYFGYNRLTTVPGERVARPSLATLDVCSNALVEVPEALRACALLATLDLSNNNINALPAWLGFAPALVRLQVRWLSAFSIFRHTIDLIGALLAAGDW
jgi:Leucine-rich repeat (LRR) protein